MSKNSKSGEDVKLTFRPSEDDAEKLGAFLKSVHEKYLAQRTTVRAESQDEKPASYARAKNKSGQIGCDKKRKLGSDDNDQTWATSDSDSIPSNKKEARRPGQRFKSDHGDQKKPATSPMRNGSGQNSSGHSPEEEKETKPPTNRTPSKTRKRPAKLDRYSFEAQLDSIARTNLLRASTTDINAPDPEREAPTNETKIEKRRRLERINGRRKRAKKMMKLDSLNERRSSLTERNGILRDENQYIEKTIERLKSAERGRETIDVDEVCARLLPSTEDAAEESTSSDEQHNGVRLGDSKLVSNNSEQGKGRSWAAPTASAQKQPDHREHNSTSPQSPAPTKTPSLLQLQLQPQHQQQHLQQPNQFRHIRYSSVPAMLDTFQNHQLEQHQAEIIRHAFSTSSHEGEQTRIPSLLLPYLAEAMSSRRSASHQGGNNRNPQQSQPQQSQPPQRHAPQQNGMLSSLNLFPSFSYQPSSGHRVGFRYPQQQETNAQQQSNLLSSLNLHPALTQGNISGRTRTNALLNPMSSQPYQQYLTSSWPSLSRGQNSGSGGFPAAAAYSSLRGGTSSTLHMSSANASFPGVSSRLPPATASPQLPPQPQPQRPSSPPPSNVQELKAWMERHKKRLQKEKEERK